MASGRMQGSPCFAERASISRLAHVIGKILPIIYVPFGSVAAESVAMAINMEIDLRLCCDKRSSKELYSSELGHRNILSGDIGLVAWKS